jgi:hypothetical protein
MKFISPKVHGALDYAVAIVLIGAPFVLKFSEVSVAAAVMSVAAGIGLFGYSLLTAYSAGVRAVIPFRVHLVLDASAAVALLILPSLFDFVGTPRVFYWVIGIAVLAVVGCTRVQEDSECSEVPLHRTPTFVS